MVNLEWKQFCNRLTSSETVKVLYRFSSHIGHLIKNSDVVTIPRLLNFLEKRIVSDLLIGNKLYSNDHINIKDVIHQLHERILLLNDSTTFNSKHISLVLNSYAKCYQTFSINTFARDGSIPNRNVFVNYVSQLLPVANRLLPYMNEQDLSLVLNCVSKLNIKDYVLLSGTNQLLCKHLTSYYRIVRNNETVNDNLILNLTPQGISLVLNCFAKLNMELDNGVLAFFVHKYLPSNIDKFLINQLILVLHSFLKLKVPIDEVYEIIAGADVSLSKKSHEFSMKLITTALYTFAKYTYFPSESIGIVEKFLNENNFKNTSELEISNLYFALARLNIRNMDILHKMNKSVIENIKTFTMHGLVNVYYSLSRLDYKGALDDVLYEQNIYETLLTEFIDKTKYNDEVIDLVALPLHMINMGFGAILNFIIDGYFYNYLFVKLNNMAQTDMQHGNLNTPNNILTKFRDDISRNKGSIKFITNHMGTQGIYQTYCICQHIMHYVDYGLKSLNLSALISLDQFFENWQSSLSRNSYTSLKDSSIIVDDVEQKHNVTSLNLTTSKIHDSVYLVVQKIVKDDICKSEDQNNYNSSKRNYSRMIIYKEYETVPYTIDIVLYEI